jgi:hypothetical protein
VLILKGGKNLYFVLFFFSANPLGAQRPGVMALAMTPWVGCLYSPPAMEAAILSKTS